MNILAALVETRDKNIIIIIIQAWVSTKWSLINSFFYSLILIFHQYSVSKIQFYYTILQDSIRRHPGLELLKALGILVSKIVQ